MSRNIAGPRQVGRASLSTRRGFVAAASLGAVSLYGLWAGLGAAPLRFWDLGGSGMDSMDMSGDGHGGAGGLSRTGHSAVWLKSSMPNTVNRMAVFPYSQCQPDNHAGNGNAGGTRGSGQSMPGMEVPDSANHAEHTMPTTTEQAASLSGETSPLDVYLLAQQWW